MKSKSIQIALFGLSMCITTSTWIIYKEYGAQRYSDAVDRYCTMSFDSLKKDSAKKAADKLYPKSFFSLNP
ncbi:MAG: hypothetical protein ACHQF4_02450 [Sphingobacteriales bacterium]|jgi:hypothetical protein